jgi:hypothetical protein
MPLRRPASGAMVLGQWHSAVAGYGAGARTSKLSTHGMMVLPVL